MDYTVTINGTEVNISNEASFVRRLDERLDTGKVIIPFDTKAEEYNMYDKFNITINDGVNNEYSLDFRIASDDVTVVSKNPLRYRHLLTLIEPTKILETQVTRELAFTQPVNEKIGNKGKVISEVAPGDVNDVDFIIGENNSYPFTVLRNDDNGTITVSTKNYPVLISTNIKGYRIRYDGRIRNEDPTTNGNVSISIYARDIGGGNEELLDTFTQFINRTEDKPFFADIDYIATSPNREIIFRVENNGITSRIENFDYDVNSEFPQINETTRYTLYDILERIRVTTPEEFSDNTTTFNETRLFSIPQELQDELSVIKAPQLFFDNLTCREAINETLKYVNAIGRIDNDGVLSLDRYNVLVNKFDENEDIIQLNRQHDINDYGTTLLSEVRNQVNESDSDTNIIVPNENGWLVSRTDNNVIVQDDNLKLILPENIYSPSRLTVKAQVDWVLFDEFGTEIDSATEILEMDVQDYLVEQKVFNSLPTAQFLNDTPTKSGYQGGNYKQNTLYYIYGDNKIENLTETLDIYNVKTTIQNVLTRAVWDEKHISTSDYVSCTFNSFSTTPEKDLLYNFEYIPLFDGKVEIEKTNVSKVKRNSVINFNQFNKLISLEKMTNKMYGDIQRYGNEEFQFSKRVGTYNDLYDLGDYTNDGFIITSREIFLYNEFIIGRYECTKDFNRISQFIGVNREYRPFEIPNIGTNYRSTTKYKEFIEVDFGSSGSENGSLTTLGMNTYLSIFEPDPLTYKPAQSCIFIPNESEENIVPDGSLLLNSLTSDGGTNTMLFTYGFDSPNVAGNQIRITNSKDVLTPTYYTNEDGTLEKYSVKFITTLNVDFSGSATPLENEIDFARDLPLIDDSYVDGGNTLLITDDILIRKDPSEITNGVYQLQTVSLNDNIIIGRGLTTYNPLVTLIDNIDEEVYLYMYFDKPYGKFDNLKVFDNPASTFLGSNHITVDYNSKSITLSNIIDNFDSFAIGDVNGNLYLAVNQTRLDGTKEINYTIKFDHINKRSNVDYDWKV